MRRVRHTLGTLTVQDVPAPAPGPGELLVRTEAIGVTLPAVRNLAKAAPGAAGAAGEPRPVSGEVAGTVEAVGPDVTAYAPGDRVTGLCFQDAYAELALLPLAMASPVPGHATAREAVALLRGGLVALGALEAARPRPGETALITAAASGVGHLALQLARIRGGAARVVAAVSDPAAKGPFLRALGADAVIGYDEPDWTADCGPAAYALDAAGGAHLTSAVRALADGGRLVAYSSGGGTLNAHDLLAGAKSVTGFQIARVAREEPHRYAAWREELWHLHATGALRPAVAAAFPLASAAEAHALLTARANLGKILLVP
ncbi:zinc-binding dehydrogenase [Streptomyces albus subsp. chlorinus]|uniref:quinone oxidoreductase family protein n=1 Tax=Streptomyces albus TaxID=1888 RepID=UPI0015710DAB|nr:zinc-binding dehydrogenase [Streptomyces albus]NSC22691.1 zinc-binding dehydrogenase [Streptomyces albus subsp. chlorinus]